jgi:negative regulator of flagellin synthesis FlgM
MKIGQPSELTALVTQAKASVPAKSEARIHTGSRQGSHSDGVAVTVSTRSLGKSSRIDVSDIDAEKVASIRAAIQDGTYTVNPEAIADKLLSNAKEMLTRTTRWVGPAPMKCVKALKMSFSSLEHQLDCLERQFNAVSSALVTGDPVSVESSSAVLQQLAVDFVQIADEMGGASLNTRHLASRIQALAQGMLVLR